MSWSFIAGRGGRRQPISALSEGKAMVQKFCETGSRQSRVDIFDIADRYYYDSGGRNALLEEKYTGLKMQLVETLREDKCNFVSRAVFLIQELCFRNESIAENFLDILENVYKNTENLTASNFHGPGFPVWQCQCCQDMERIIGGLNTGFLKMISNMICVFCSQPEDKVIRLPCRHYMCWGCWLRNKGLIERGSMGRMACTRHEYTYIDNDWVFKLTANDFCTRPMTTRGTSSFGPSKEQMRTDGPNPMGKESLEGGRGQSGSNEAKSLEGLKDSTTCKAEVNNEQEPHYESRKSSLCPKCDKLQHGDTDCQFNTPSPMSGAVGCSSGDKSSPRSSMGTSVSSPASLDSDNPRAICPNPECGKFIYSLAQDKVNNLLDCIYCKSIFCRKCRQEFHGPTECNAPLALVRESSVSPTQLSVLNRKDVTSSPPSLTPGDKESNSVGAEAQQYEERFYEGDEHTEATVDVAEINEAFSLYSPSPEPKTDWPWEKFTSTSLYSYDVEQQYGSLLPENWVEDELLENAIKIMINKSGRKGKIGFLESFVLKYATRKDYGELPRVLAKKEILQCDVVLVMVNTDFSGHGGHWILAAINIADKTIVLFDTSLVLTPNYYKKPFYFLLRTLHAAHEVQSTPFQVHQWRLSVCLDVVQQQNAYDCGPLVVCNAYAAIHNVLLRDSPGRSFKIREWILHLLKEGKNNRSNRKDKHKEKEGKKKEKLPSVAPEKNISHFAPVGLQIHFDFFSQLNKA